MLGGDFLELQLENGILGDLAVLVFRQVPEESLEWLKF